MDYSIIYLVHMFLVAPLFIYPFIAQKYFDVKSTTILLSYNDSKITSKSFYFYYFFYFFIFLKY